MSNNNELYIVTVDTVWRMLADEGRPDPSLFGKTKWLARRTKRGISQ